MDTKEDDAGYIHSEIAWYNVSSVVSSECLSMLDSSVCRNMLDTAAERNHVLVTGLCDHIHLHQIALYVGVEICRQGSELHIVAPSVSSQASSVASVLVFVCGVVSMVVPAISSALAFVSAYALALLSAYADVERTQADVVLALVAGVKAVAAISGRMPVPASGTCSIALVLACTHHQ